MYYRRITGANGKKVGESERTERWTAGQITLGSALQFSGMIGAEGEDISQEAPVCHVLMEDGPTGDEMERRIGYEGGSSKRVNWPCRMKTGVYILLGYSPLGGVISLICIFKKYLKKF